MFICLIPKIGTKYSLAKGLGTQYRDVSQNEVFHFVVLSVRGSRAVKPRLVSCRKKQNFGFSWFILRRTLLYHKYRINEILGGGSLRSPFYYRVLGLAPAARPRREHFVFAKKRSALFLSWENLQAIGAQR